MTKSEPARHKGSSRIQQSRPGQLASRVNENFFPVKGLDLTDEEVRRRKVLRSIPAILVTGIVMLAVADQVDATRMDQPPAQTNLDRDQNPNILAPLPEADTDAQQGSVDRPNTDR